ncbi:MAG: COG3014 family protein [Thermodesulfobacteriota bacterium]
MRRILIPTLALALTVLTSACGPSAAYHQRLTGHLAAGECEKAAELVEESRDDYGANAELLYLLDGAMVNFNCGDQERAQRQFQEADQLAERLWTESISANTLALVTNDYLLPYAGEDFERVMIHLLAALSYLKSDQLDEALVECRRLDSLLTLYRSKYEEASVYKEDAFARYLSGMLNEDDQAMDDAYIDYAKAYGIYADYKAAYGTPAPPILVEDLLRTAKTVDRVEDAEKLVPKEDRQRHLSRTEARDMGRIVLIHLNGEAPQKQEDRIYLPTFGYGPLTIAFPRMEILPPDCRKCRLILTATTGMRITAEGFLAEDINRIAVKDLDDRKARILLKAAARAAAKQVAIHQIANTSKDRDSRNLIVTAFNIVNIFLEQADTRSWRTLPGEIYLARAYVPPGTYKVAVGTCHGAGKPMDQVRVAAGETRYLIVDGRYE